ncbi:MAG: hypothetical protein FD161_406 [Limisphaerales bacterium]|nr:MAG: hypothetical protein FD161_406 [Limisphaerales bacterium]KAG0510311.1 MAG: hypothetical protein E1N63_406 [Limisphaerales bacterium]TXT51498.1 MAG: hypothetical protein FD140_1536 [Limisphaerales bacterium]
MLNTPPIPPEQPAPGSTTTPPQPASTTAPPPPLPGAPGTDPAERVPIAGMFGASEAILRQPRRVWFQLTQDGQSQLTLVLLGIAILGALAYGLVVGTFTGGDQLWAAPVKIAGGLLLSGLICLPSLYIFACLSGANTRLTEVCGLVAGLLALTTVLLIGFAPVAWVFSQSTESVAAMGALHLAFAAIAVGFGMKFLARGFEQLNARFGGGLRVWVIIFVLVLLQMTAALRPILGKAEAFLPAEKKFFVSHWTDSLKASGNGASR